MQLDGQVVIVTGAGGGLGREYALLLGAYGARVVVNDIGAARPDSEQRPADAVVAEIVAAGGEAVADFNDVSTEAGGAAMITNAVDSFGDLHALVHNAGILRDKSLSKLTMTDVQDVFGVHLNGGFHVLLPAFAHMRKNGYGRIVLTTSSSGLLGNFGQANYGAAKMGLVGLMNVAALEGDRNGIKVNAIAPGARTQMTEGLLGDLDDVMDPRHVAPMVAYLVSPGCTVTKEIFTAAAGRFGRYAIGVTTGWYAGAGKTATPEDIETNLDAIRDLTDLEVLTSGVDEVALLQKVLASPGTTDPQESK